MNKEFSKDLYDKMLSSVIVNSNQTEVKENDVDVDHMTDLFNELGLIKNVESKLILWNDHVNNMQDVVIALFEVCKIEGQEAIKIMYEAHTKGRAVAKTGSREEMIIMKNGLNNRNIEATVE